MNFKRKILSKFSLVQLQPLYKRLLYTILRLMNYGAANSPEESGEKWLIKKLLHNRPDLIILDAGANTGQYANLCLDLGGERVKLYCFEPVSASFFKLQSSTSKYSNVRLYRKGLGEVQKEAEIWLPENSTSVQASMIHMADFGPMVKEKIQLDTIDHFLATESIPHVDLLKIDTEGFEREVIIGAAESIKRGAIDIIQFEFGHAQIAAGYFMKDLLLLLENYKVYRLLQNGLFPLSYGPLDEIFLTTNYVAVRKESNALTDQL